MRALLFDFDGLILDTETPEFEVWSDVFAEHGVAMPAGYWTQVIGRGAEQQIERPPQLLARLAGLSPRTPEQIEEIRVRIRKRILEQSVRPGVLSLLNQAAEAGLKLGIASSSRHEWVDRYLTKLGLLERFHQIVCADDVSRAKPFPDLYLLVCERLAVGTDEVVALEDSPNGIAAAKAAGVFVIAVPNPVTVHLDLSAADARVEDLAPVTVASLRSLLVKRVKVADPRREPAPSPH